MNPIEEFIVSVYVTPWQAFFTRLVFACKSGCSAGEIYRMLEKKRCDSTFSAAELKKAVDIGYQEVSKQKKLSGGAISASDESLIVSKSHMGARGNEKGKEGAYWLGEEYRKQTPFFPDGVCADRCFRTAMDVVMCCRKAWSLTFQGLPCIAY